ncbi:MAG: DNA repair protein RecO [Candidatus Polarisedimenticolaceae bacterium]|nr:DNA repair protein RecO [Candidatus Polarisedimenticolaceae bacterium]
MQLYECYILHRRDYRNSSLLLEIFSKELGRFPAIAKGVKSNRSKKQGELQCFHPLQLGLAGRGEIRNITTIDSERRPYMLTGTALYCGLYLSELLMRMTARNDPHPVLFEQYEQTLAELAQGALLDHALRYFEIGMLETLGYGLLLNCQATGEPLQPDLHYHYKIEHGPVPVTGQRRDRSTLRGSTLLALSRAEPLERVAAQEAKRLMRSVLAHYLGTKPLKSRELFRPIKPSLSDKI